MKINPSGIYPNKINSNFYYGSAASADPTLAKMAAIVQKQKAYNLLSLDEQVTRDLQELANLAKERFDESVINFAVQRLEEVLKEGGYDTFEVKFTVKDIIKTFIPKAQNLKEKYTNVLGKLDNADNPDEVIKIFLLELKKHKPKKTEN